MFDGIARMPGRRQPAVAQPHRGGEREKQDAHAEERHPEGCHSLLGHVHERVAVPVRGADDEPVAAPPPA
jgi:hypothetical protein